MKVLISLILILMLTTQDVHGDESSGPPVSRNAVRSCSEDLEALAPSEITRAQLIFKLLGEFWDSELRAHGFVARRPKLSYYSKYVKTACGAIKTEIGPVYCMASETIYIDPSWYAGMAKSTGVAPETATIFILAHEYGHHVTKVTGLFPALYKIGEFIPSHDRDAASKMNELMADGLAGHFIAQIVKYQVILDEERVALEKFVLATGDVEGGKCMDHGTGPERLTWLRRGSRARSFNEINPFKDPSLLGQVGELTRSLLQRALSSLEAN